MQTSKEKTADRQNVVLLWNAGDETSATLLAEELTPVRPALWKVLCGGLEGW